jgi:hypothetical protein
MTARSRNDGAQQEGQPAGTTARASISLAVAMTLAGPVVSGLGGT